MAGRLADKVAIVTGAGSRGPGVGTGKAMSILFAREGAKVLLVDREPEHAEETLAQIREEGGEASVFAADVTRAGDCEALVAAAQERYGGLTVLVNNVGIGSRGSVLQESEDGWDRVMAVNVKSMMLVSKSAIPVMADGGGGSIINISSVAAIRGTSLTAYAASKGAVVSLTTSMAAQHARQQIRVNCILPGMIYTPMVAGELTEELRDRRRRSAPLQTEGTAWDVAWGAVYLASDESRWVTGLQLIIDGGFCASHPLAR